MAAAAAADGGGNAAVESQDLDDGLDAIMASIDTGEQCGFGPTDAELADRCDQQRRGFVTGSSKLLIELLVAIIQYKFKVTNSLGRCSCGNFDIILDRSSLHYSAQPHPARDMRH